MLIADVRLEYEYSILFGSDVISSLNETVLLTCLTLLGCSEITGAGFSIFISPSLSGFFAANAEGTRVGNSGMARGDITMSGFRVTALLYCFIL